MKIKFTRPWKIYVVGDVIEPENDAVANEFLAAGLCVPVNEDQSKAPKKPRLADKAYHPEEPASSQCQ